MSNLEFSLVLTEKQRKCSNAYLHNENDYCWLLDTTVYFDNIIDYSFVCNHVLESLQESGWQVHKTYLARALDPLTLDITGITECQKDEDEDEEEEEIEKS
jgi:hypothetical protein